MTDATELDEAAVRARLEAATEGPWHIGPDSAGQATAVRSPKRDHVASCRYDEDAEFIAHARTDVERLLAALDDARAERDRARLSRDAAKRAMVRQIRARKAAESALEAVRALAGTLDHNDMCHFPDDECICIQIEFRNALLAALGGEVEDGVFGDPEIHALLTRAALATPTTPEETR